jgi:hypothetical protein
MTHDEAKKSLAAEAYILDDLDPAERTAFEEHFFDCTDCTADVLDAATVADGIRTENTNVVAFPNHYSRWAAAAAGAAVVIGLAYQYVPQIAGLRHHPSNPPRQAAHATASEQIIKLEETRAAQRKHVIRGDQFIELEETRAAQRKQVIRGDQATTIDFTIPPQDVPPAIYICELRDAAGILIKSRNVSQREADEAVSISVPPHVLHSGEYDIVIRGGDREIPGYHFTVGVQ